MSRVGKQTAHIQLWDPAQGLRRTAQVEESLSALAVRDDGRFIAVGTMFTGTVDIYIAFSLQVKCLNLDYFYLSIQLMICISRNLIENCHYIWEVDNLCTRKNCQMGYVMNASE